jgi:hypothetical protein
MTLKMVLCRKCGQLTSSFRAAENELGETIYVCDPGCQRLAPQNRIYSTAIKLLVLAPLMVACMFTQPTPNTTTSALVYRTKPALAVVNADALNLRECPRVDCAADSVGLRRGETVVVVHSGDWSYIKSLRGAGWVNSEFLSKH